MGALLVIGPYPPPVHGAALATQLLVDRLREEGGIVTAIDISPRSLRRNSAYHLSRFLLGLRAALHLFVHGRKYGHVYLSISGGSGVFYDIAFAAVARLMGRRLMAHHHAFTYINRWDWRFAVLNRILGRAAIHICLCGRMASKFRALYASALNVMVLSNAALVSPGTDARRRRDAGLVIGHLSNLSVEKGIGTVIDVMREVSRKHPSAQLVVAGPATTKEVEALLRSAQTEFGHRLDYRGPVSGASKNDFFNDIDVFLFPSRYPNEAEPLVVLEALASGVPVIATDRGCLCEDIGTAGITLPDTDEFLARAAAELGRFLERTEALATARRRAAERYAQLRGEALTALAHLAAIIGARG